MKEQIQQLIAAGRTKEALEMLVQMNGEAILLQSQFNQAEKQFNLGMIDFTEWGRVQARITFAALEMAGKSTPAAAPTSTGGGAHHSSGHTGGSQPQPAAASTTKVFISYNHGDGEIARQVCTYLEKNNMDVILDQDDMAAGRSIMEFIQDSIKRADAVVSIVSSKSLQSGWVGQESVASMYAVWLADKKFIPVKLDNVVFDIDFQITATTNLTQKIKDLDKKIKQLEKIGGDAYAPRDDLKRIKELKNNFGTIIQRFTSVLMLDISGDNFEPSMKKVLGAIQN